MAPFLNSLKDNNQYFKLIDREAYFKVYPAFIESLLNRPNSIITLAKLSDDTVLGWSLAESSVLHYVWVKKDLRRQGIGRALVPLTIQSFTHLTTYGISIWSKYQHLTFDPFR